MELGMIGLGRMGGSMTLRLLEGGHRVVVYARTASAIAEYASRGAVGAASVPELAKKLGPPRVVWMMVPAGDAVEQTLAALRPVLAAGDIVMDGGNSNYHDSQRRTEALRGAGIHYLDAGVSGGIWGRSEGYCLMVGGEEAAFRRVEPLLKTLAPPEGYAYMGLSGAGHFVKMVHNGIEYGLMQAYAEGFELLRESGMSLDLRRIAALWRRGSVVRSWLLELLERALERDPGLEGLKGYVEDSGEGRWTVQEAIARAVPAPAITQALFARFRSRRENAFADRVLAALRHEFGGHEVKHG
jgi:6-phosphogluconate dehydrogenase